MLVETSFHTLDDSNINIWTFAFQDQTLNFSIRFQSYKNQKASVSCLKSIDNITEDIWRLLKRQGRQLQLFDMAFSVNMCLPCTKVFYTPVYVHVSPLIYIDIVCHSLTPIKGTLANNIDAAHCLCCFLQSCIFNSLNTVHFSKNRLYCRMLFKTFKLRLFFIGNDGLSGKQVGSQASLRVTRQLAWIQSVCISINAVPALKTQICDFTAWHSPSKVQWT